MTQKLHELVDARGFFKLSQWRSYVTMAALETHPQASALCPFGFELTGDPQFLTRNLRRFYTYVSAPEGAAISADILGEKTCHRLLEILSQEAPVFHASIGHVVHPRGRFHARPGGTRLLQLYAFTQSQPILQTYAHYVLATPNAILDSTLKEIQEFDVNDGARRYLFQLTLMLTSVYPEVAGLSAARLSELNDMVAMLARRPVTHERVRTPPTPEETALLRGVVVPFAERVLKFCAGAGEPADLVVFQAVDIHSGSPISGRVRESVFVHKMSLVRQLYESYPDRTLRF